MEKILVLYVYHEINERVEYFIRNAIFEDKNVDFLIISNNKKNNIGFPSYVKELYRDNIGFDFGAWSDGLLTDNLYKNYDYFIFVNSSVIGPFIPSYCNIKWTDIYINGLKNNDNVKLFGNTINCLPFPHIQSYIFSMNRDTLEYLISCNIFTLLYYTKNIEETIWNKELLMSKKILENNWNIGSLMNYYKGIDFTFKKKKKEEYNIEYIGDVMCNNHIYKIWNIYEIVFIKGNRDININKIFI